ncbi:CBS domain-containing protein [Legionella londiniensis]|uniref:CBS domain protein n=1 Tax=Legionella londiniensis TaxID=45068 RepID=A0A0W0VKU9_9GAMM|nr:CBS domain-containing protein [Legionella londiniensis]KTD20730.1 CBS domain protein [Legionella londiniensis]STX92797.1 CBS domain protein [Legionella londiniensis]
MANLLHSILPEPRRPIVYVHPDVAVSRCVAMMVEDNIGALVVTDDENILGIVSERDIIRSLLYKGLSPESTKAYEILYADVSVLKETDTVEKAMEVMTVTRRRHILVTDENEALIAIVSIGDLLLNLLEDKMREIEQLENYIHTY